ncbi:unnamed protein product [Rotaria sordida]|uniref:Beta-mannosidase-like galactose-binding domain-containing protein n=1 Tax=Rotaria sordida TaxID=392033 RepID=A0A818JW16_9BILA|nr:unnamed protein product [Rotaria sordida]
MRRDVEGSTGLHRLGLLMAKMGEWDKAKDIYELLIGKTDNDQHLMLGSLHHQLGVIYYQKTDLNNALVHYQKSLMNSLKYLPSDGLRLSPTYTNIGLVLCKQGDSDRGITYYQQALDIETKESQPNKEQIAILYNNIGSALQDQGRFHEALENYEQALQINITILPKYHPSLAIRYNNIGMAQGNIPGAIHTVFFAAKQIPDPYLDYNDIDLRYLIYNNWTFTKKIDLFSDFLASNQTTIHLKQIDTVAIITINNYLIGRTNSMFMPYTIHIANSCLKFENEISIDFESPVLYALKQANAYNDTVPSDCPSPAQHGECYVQFIRKESCSFSWDWVSIESKNKTNIFIWRRS